MAELRLPPSEYYAGLPKVVASASALIRDEQDRVLLVDPAYRPGDLLLPGGGMDDGEFPIQTARREVHEEVGIELASDAPLLAVDWRQARSEHPAICVFVFDGGHLTNTEATHAVRLDTNELLGWRFYDRAEREELLPEFRARRVEACLAALARATVMYLHNGEPAS